MQIWERTDFESKSQLRCWIEPRRISCCKYGKELILKANHNRGDKTPHIYGVVANMGKNWFWKQITTTLDRINLLVSLLQIWERTDFESKSQLNALPPEVLTCCCKYGKELILKANHNLLADNTSKVPVVANMGKNWFWKQITTFCFVVEIWVTLLQIWERTDFESKSQLWVTKLHGGDGCCKYGKELILKANHNNLLW